MVVLTFASVFPGASILAAQTCPEHLFVVGRSKNANIVAYDANRTPAGDLVASEPVIAYWLLDGKEGAREELSRVERVRAYGVQPTGAGTANNYKMAFRANRKRTFTVRVLNGCPVAIAPIGGREGILRKLFVRSTEAAFPSVEYVELFGEDPATGAPLYEKFVPPK